MPLQLAIDEASSTGRRPDNQDAIRVVTPAPWLAASKGHLLAIADGVSQCADGGLAARSTLQALAMDYYATPETWTPQQAMDRLLAAHNRWLRSQAHGQSLLTTLTALVLRGRHVWLTHIGDCRAYLLREGQLQRLTSEHVWQQAGMRHVLKRALGLDEQPLADYQCLELATNDRLLLLSDGVWGWLPDSRIRQLLTTQPVSGCCQTLLDEALQAGSDDNLSALLVQVEQVPQTLADDATLQAAQLPVAPALREGHVFEGWGVLHLMHQSRQSLIYRVSDAEGVRWLLKTLPPALAGDTSAARALLLEEWFMRRVQGPTVPELATLPDRQHLYFVQREYAGCTLAERMARQGLWSLAEFRQLAPPLISAVAHLHRRNLLHRDLKPENLHLGEDGVLRLLDFGLAFCPGLSPVDSGGLPGTPGYHAPEQYSGVEPQPQQDIHALGVTLYRLLVGHFPHGDIEPFQRPRFGLPKPPGRYRPDLPDWLSRSLLRAIDPNPERRYQTCEEWLLDLQRAEHSSIDTPRPLIERDPLTLWRSIAMLALLLNLLLLVALLY